MDMLETPACRIFPDGTVAFINSYFCKTLQRHRDNLIGRPLSDHVPAAFHPITDAMVKLSRHEPAISLSFPILDATGTRCWCVWDCKGKFDDAGALEIVTVFARIVTGDLRYRNALEQLLQIANDPALNSQERARGILACSLDYFGADIASIVGFSAAGQRQLDALGLAEPALARRPRKFSSPGAEARQDQSDADEDLPTEKRLKALFGEKTTLAIADLATQDSNVGDQENDGVLTSGSILATEIVLDQPRLGAIVFTTRTAREKPFPDEKIQFCQLVAQWLAFILEQHQFLSELSFRQQKYKHLFEYAPVMIYILSADDRIIEANNSWLTTLGYRHDEVANRPIADFIAAPADDSAFSPHDDGVAGDNSRNLIAKDGSIVETQISEPGPEKSGVPRLAVMVDVTERNRALQELTNNRQTLTQANEGLKRFNTIAAHDLQEPLRKIRLFGGLLKDALDTNVDPEVETAIEKIISAANRLTTLVKDLLLYSREGERVYVKQTIDMGPLLDEVVNDLTLLITETGARIKLHDLPQIAADPVPLQRLFTNLILNALKYRHDERAPEIEIFSRQTEDEETEIVIRDNGIGLREGEADIIFAPFVRVRPQKATGSGIGLALCKSIVNGHGWTIHAENREAGGSDFIINLGLFS